MEVLSVQSSVLEMVGYDEDRKVLRIRFHSQAVYQFEGVASNIFAAFCHAPSKGAFFNAHIRGRFPYRLLPKTTLHSLPVQAKPASVDTPAR